MTKKGTGRNEPITDREHFLQNVHDDPEFHYDAKIVYEWKRRHPTDHSRLYEIYLGFSERWGLSIDEFRHLAWAQTLPVGTSKQGVKIGYDIKENKTTIVLDDNATEAQLMRAWRTIQTARKSGTKKPKAKEPAYPFVTYAVFKGLRAGRSYKQIHAALTDEDSDIYDERIARLYPHYAEMRLYYNRHQPKNRNI
ncbi:MAG: hypothetical protein ABIQ04_01635 [Candidatus Saccharimonadales bacterium]